MSLMKITLMGNELFWSATSVQYVIVLVHEMKSAFIPSGGAPEAASLCLPSSEELRLPLHCAR